MQSQVSKPFVSTVKTLGVRSFATNVCYSDMFACKHDFVHFVTTAANVPGSSQAQEMHKFLVKCFVDNDSDYDGRVSYKGFNNMILQAATPPRRFGFAPHTRELYSSKAEFELARKALFNQLDTEGGGRITLESWLKWGKEHIVGKQSSLVEHCDSRWERSKEDMIAFYKGVSIEASSHNAKASSSTQYKEFYILTNRYFQTCDSKKNGCLDEAAFNKLVAITSAHIERFGFDWYAGTEFSRLQRNGVVTWSCWFNHSLKVCNQAAAAL